MFKSLALALVATASTLGAGAANAAHVSWSIGVNLPVYAAPVPVYAPAPVYAPVPVYAEAPPVYVGAPVPVYGAPPVVYYPRRAVYVRPVPIVYPRHGQVWAHGYRHGWRRD